MLHDLDRATAVLSESVRLQRAFHDDKLTAETLESIARLVAVQRRYAHAAQLYGAAARLRAATGAQLDASARSRHEEALAALHAALGEAGFQRGWAVGEALSAEQAFDVALSILGGR